ncbi:LacI family transcriptional regulator [Streptomyces sp. WAC05374]|uniref:LacI family DNA-binding transcriptional regulator n=1 Tax=Streptomyces sp. WAC05374 TaxID=2487420 RepID=UPI000F866A40|nr:LacI family DNA-binding transcriptional regulator [Streptomyces sp. WAC05374]RST15687.1 LacI family transcriptional regulator [Streptomyces sp. WAC05374]TDF44223.1 LacI family transcriptional regulator [Streptomyces sp. WAC05374]TDF53847.1 LacI family transcriptional regulator [Streptomyces sp. WAC05374]TDF58679.1 LacI family transcriptional regulator [Streptomyces sp. WAC05374]
MTVTLADVAARARVSPATVSRVLNGNYPVAASTRERVLRAVDELDYVLNGPASALAAATSDLVGILVNDIADPFFGIMAGAAQTAIGEGAPGRAGGEKLAVVCNTGGSPERELTYLTLLQRQRAAAVVLTGGAVEDPGHLAAMAAKLARLADAGTRVVLCGRPPVPSAGDATAAALAFDNRGGARRLTEHLLELGHRRIGYVAGPEERTTTRHRLEGHRAALEAAGLAGAPDRLTVHGPYDRRSGYDATLELLRREPGLTAIVAANDTVALGACAALRERGLRIPDDVSVAGFDDLPFSVDAVPALTTVRLPLHEAGARAGRLATGTEAPPPGGIATIGGELMVRASTGRPRS